MGPRYMYPKPLGLIALFSSHHTSGSTCRKALPAGKSLRASSVCSKVTWTVAQSCRSSSSGKTAKESADFSNPWVKGVPAGQGSMYTHSPPQLCECKEKVIPLITPGVIHVDSMNGVSLMKDPVRLKPSCALRSCPAIRKGAFLKILVLS